MNPETAVSRNGQTPIPPHFTISTGALAKVKALTEKSKTTPLQIVALGDSNATPGNFNGELWERGNFARLLDQSLAWMRGNTTTADATVLGPQLQVIKPMTMGNGPVNSPTDTPWHPSKRRWIGQFATLLGPFGNSYKTMGGYCTFDNPANTARWFGFIVDRTASGEDWEKYMDRVAVGFFGRGNSDKGAGVTTGLANNPNGSTYGGPNYSGLCSVVTIKLIDITSVDLSAIPSGGWDAADAGCIAIKAAIDALSPTVTSTFDPRFGSGESLPGYLTNWLSGMTANKKWLVQLSVADGAGMGAWIEYITLNNSTISGGVCIWDFAYSGNAISQCEWKRYNNDGTPMASWSGDVGDFVTDAYVRPSLLARTTMRAENSYGTITNYSGRSSWATGVHNAPGLDAVVVSLLANDVGNSSLMPLAIYNHAYNLIQQVVRANPEAVVIFNAMPCIASNVGGGDFNRDYFFADANHVKVRATWKEFLDAIRNAIAQFPSNALLLDYQGFYGNVAPTVLKGRIGHFGTYKRENGDPIDPLHTKISTWQLISAQDIGRLFSTYCY